VLVYRWCSGSSFDGLRTSLLCEFDIFITALFLGPLGRAAILSSSLSIPTNQYVFEHCFSDKQENIAVTRDLEDQCFSRVRRLRLTAASFTGAIRVRTVVR